MGAQQGGHGAEGGRVRGRAVAAGQRQFEVQLAEAVARGDVGQAAEAERGAQYREQRPGQGGGVDVGEQFGGGLPAAPHDLGGQVVGGGVDAFEDGVHEGAELRAVGQLVHERGRGGGIGFQFHQRGGLGFVAGAARVLGLGVGDQLVRALGQRRVGGAPPVRIEGAVEAGGGQFGAVLLGADATRGRRGGGVHGGHRDHIGGGGGPGGELGHRTFVRRHGDPFGDVGAAVGAAEGHPVQRAARGGGRGRPPRHH